MAGNHPAPDTGSGTRARHQVGGLSMSDIQSEPSSVGRRQRWKGPIVAALGGAIIAFAVLAVIGAFLEFRPVAIVGNMTTAGPATPRVVLPKQTEAVFLAGIKSPPDEWSDGRADHRLIAYAVFNCKRLAGVTIDTMPRQMFTALLLDLTPNGNHVFETKDGDDAIMAARDKDAPTFHLTSTDHEILSLSNSIARARLLAAGVASSNAPDVYQLGLITLIITALATLFVTLQGRMKPVELDDAEKKDLERSSFFRRVGYSLSGPGAGFRLVAFFAISLSITGTSLTGLKQIYDPTRTLAQNTRALLELRQLHQKLAHGIACRDGTKELVRHKKILEWSDAVVRIRGSMIPGYGAYTNLDVGTAARRPDGNELQLQPPTLPISDTAGTTALSSEPSVSGRTVEQ